MTLLLFVILPVSKRKDIKMNIYAKLETLLHSPQIVHCLEKIRKNEEKVLTFQKEMALIEAPTFQEEARGQALFSLFQEMGLTNVTTDDIGNTFGTLFGTDSKSRGNIVIEAHMDTVFSKGSVHEIIEKDGVIYCPGIADDTRGIALLYGLLLAMKGTDIPLRKNLIFLGTVREEGAGGCGGLKHYLRNHPDTECCISVDGPDSDLIVLGGPGTRTIEVVFHGKGDHAYAGCGYVGNPVRAAIRAMNKISSFTPGESPRTTCEITGFQAGDLAGIHAIPSRASITLNFRSEEKTALENLESFIFSALRDGVQEENDFVTGCGVTYEIIDHVNIPVSCMPRESELVQTMDAVIKSLGMTPLYDTKCPTNANITIGSGLPGICIGGGGKAGSYHSPQEWFDPADSYLGVQAAFLLCMILTDAVLS